MRSSAESMVVVELMDAGVTSVLMSLADAAGLPRGARLPGDGKPKASARDMLSSWLGRW